MLKPILFALLFALSAQAHEGDHGPGSVPLQKGGVMRALETVNLELVFKEGEVRIYPFDVKTDPKNPGKLAPSQPDQYPVSATVELPRSKPQPLPLKVSGDHWLAKFDPKGAHRFTVVLDIKQGGHEDKIKWTVEPKK